VPCLVLSIPASLSVNILYAKYSKLKHHTVRKCYNCRTLPQEIFSTVRRSLHVVWACCKVWPDYACLWSTKPCHTTRVRSPDRRWHITSVWLHFTCGFSRWCQRNVHDVLSLFDCFFTNARVCKCTLFALVSSSTFMPEYNLSVESNQNAESKRKSVESKMRKCGVIARKSHFSLYQKPYVTSKYVKMRLQPSRTTLGELTTPPDSLVSWRPHTHPTRHLRRLDPRAFGSPTL